MKKVIIGITVLVAVLAILMVNLSDLSYESNLVKEGSYKGLNIGAKKQEAYEILSRLLKDIDDDRIFFISHEAGRDLSAILSITSGMRVLVQTRLLPTEYDFFKDLDAWEIYIDGDYGHSIKLTFCQELLCEVYYHKQRFELP